MLPELNSSVPLSCPACWRNIAEGSFLIPGVPGGSTIAVLKNYISDHRFSSTSKEYIYIPHQPFINSSAEGKQVQKMNLRNIDKVLNILIDSISTLPQAGSFCSGKLTSHWHWNNRFWWCKEILKFSSKNWCKWVF